MTLIYKYQGKQQTIEEMIKNNPYIKDVWNECLREENKFWGNITINDLIIETSEAFEEEIAIDDEETPVFIKNDDKPFDLNVLLDTLR